MLLILLYWILICIVLTFGEALLLREVFLFLCYVYIIPGAATMEDTDLNRIINKLKLSTKEPQPEK